MTDRLVEKLVARGIALDREVADKTEELKDIKRQLIDLAKMDGDGQAPTDGGGWSYTLRDNEGNIARVTAPAPSLKSTIDGEGELIEKIRSLLDCKATFTALFSPAPAYKLVGEFREVATALLGRNAGKLLKLVTSKSATKVSFETKEAA